MSKDQNEIIPSKHTQLFVDVGNSSIKAAFTVGTGWSKPEKSGISKATDLLNWINKYNEKFDLIIITSVVEEVTEALVRGLETNRYRVLSEEDIPGDLLDYETPETLGLDRFFGCYGAIAHTKKAAVVIDAGTACTVDYMTPDYIFRGGVIMPGISILEQSLKEYAPSLPRVQRELPEAWPGKSTRGSLQWGITGTFATAVNGFLDKYEEEFDTFDLVLTGGGAKMIAPLVQRESKVRPMLVFEGMKKFLEDYL